MSANRRCENIAKNTVSDYVHGYNITHHDTVNPPPPHTTKLFPEKGRESKQYLNTYSRVLEPEPEKPRNVLRENNIRLHDTCNRV